MHSFFDKKLTIISISIIFILFGIGVVYMVYSSLFPNKKIITNEVPVISESDQNRTPQPIPQPRFGNWVESDKIIFAKALPKANSSRYLFKTEHRPEEISRLTSVFNTNEQHSQEGVYHLYTEVADESSVLLFNTENGSIRYISTDGIPLSTDTETDQVSVEENIYSFLRSIGRYDNSLRINATYTIEGHDDIVYYELHRDWDVMGYPILNPIGILNIEEQMLLHELSYYSKNTLTDMNSRIMKTSDNTDGLARANDFNTITIGINSESGNLVSLDSNMRTLLVNTAYSSSQLITREEALEKLRAGEHQFFITEPSGEGNASYSKVYPDNTAKSNEAVITEVLLSYLEKPSQTKQQSLEPYYLFRGYSMLDSGYRVSFYAAVSAIQGLNTSELSFSNNTQVAGVMAQAENEEDSSQKQGTLDFPTSIPTQIPTVTSSPTITNIPDTPTVVPSITNVITSTIAPSITSSISPSSIPNTDGKENCDFVLSMYYENFIEFEGMTFAQKKTESENVAKTWVYVLKENESYSTIQADLDSFVEKFRAFINSLPDEDIDRKLNAGKVRVMEDFINDLDKRPELDIQNYACTLRITGLSPSLFLYGTDQTEYTLSVGRNITYSDPAPMNTTWKITSVQDGLVINNVERPYLYYEYEPVTFEKPLEGWVIAKGDRETFVKKLGKKLQLTSAEIERLQDELTIALSGTSAPYYFIGKISENELNTKVPLTVSPRLEHIQRFHLYIEPMQASKTVNNPQITPISRSDEMILELGAVLVN